MGEREDVILYEKLTQVEYRRSCAGACTRRKCTLAFGHRLCAKKKKRYCQFVMSRRTGPHRPHSAAEFAADFRCARGGGGGLRVATYSLTRRYPRRAVRPPPYAEIRR